jgi:hypothetical protein
MQTASPAAARSTSSLKCAFASARLTLITPCLLTNQMVTHSRKRELLKEAEAYPSLPSGEPTARPRPAFRLVSRIEQRFTNIAVNTAKNSQGSRYRRGIRALSAAPTANNSKSNG